MNHSYRFAFIFFIIICWPREVSSSMQNKVKSFIPAKILFLLLNMTNIILGSSKKQFQAYSPQYIESYESLWLQGIYYCLIFYLLHVIPLNEVAVNEIFLPLHIIMFVLYQIIFYFWYHASMFKNSSLVNDKNLNFGIYASFFSENHMKI